jgi:hypothetical protein
MLHVERMHNTAHDAKDKDNKKLRKKDLTLYNKCGKMYLCM